MSRTYRAAKLPIDCRCSALVGWRWQWARDLTPPTQEETDRELTKARREGVTPTRCCRCWTNRKYDYHSKRNHKRDRKPSHKSPRTDKKIYGRSRKAKINDAMRKNDYDNIPTFKRTNDWLRNWDYY